MSDDPRIARLLERVGATHLGDERATRALVAALDALGDDELDDDELTALAQACARAIARVSAAEAEVIVGRVAHVPPAEREARLGRLLAGLAPIASACFTGFHPASVERITRRRLETFDHGDTGADGASIAVAFVDLCGSTRWMLQAGDDEVRALADVVHRAGHEVAGRHEVLTAKFLGDGFFLVGGERARLIAAAVDAVRVLGARAPMRASGGIAHGRVVRRGGDYFGPPVNLAARLSEVAVAGELLADAGALAEGVAIDRWATVRPRGLRRALRVAVLEPDGDPDAP